MLTVFNYRREHGAAGGEFAEFTTRHHLLYIRLVTGVGPVSGMSTASFGEDDTAILDATGTKREGAEWRSLGESLRTTALAAGKMLSEPGHLASTAIRPSIAMAGAVLPN